MLKTIKICPLTKLKEILKNSIFSLGFLDAYEGQMYPVASLCSKLTTKELNK